MKILRVPKELHPGSWESRPSRIQRRERSWNPGLYATFQLRDGRLLRATGVSYRWLSTLNYARKARCGQIVDQLNALLEASRTAERPQPAMTHDGQHTHKV